MDKEIFSLRYDHGMKKLCVEFPMVHQAGLEKGTSQPSIQHANHHTIGIPQKPHHRDPLNYLHLKIQYLVFTLAYWACLTCSRLWLRWYPVMTRRRRVFISDTDGKGNFPCSTEKLQSYISQSFHNQVTAIIYFTIISQQSFISHKNI